VPGLAESLFANWESGIVHGHLAAIWATVPAQAFAVASFMFERWLKSQVGRGGRDGQSDKDSSDDGFDENDTEPCPHFAALSVEDAAVQAFLHARDCLSEPLSQRQVSDQFGLTRHRVAEVVAPHLPPGRRGEVNGHSFGAADAETVSTQ
jgi:hypothetical protein